MSATAATHTYTSDIGDYGVTIVKAGHEASKVRIVSHDSASCALPIGVVITVLNARVI